MDLRQALRNKEYNEQEINDLIEEWRDMILIDGENPEELLRDEGLEPDYVFDLLNEIS